VLVLLLALFASFKTTKVLAQAVDIGSISELNGIAQVVRDKPYGAELQFPIQQLDNIKTQGGKLAVTFVDETIVRVMPHSKLVIDSYIYDANPTKSEMALRFASGTARFVTGKFNNKKAIHIKTQSADVFVRGTDFTITTTPETGSSLVILLPDEYGNPSGEILVKTAMGEVLLNQAFQATTTLTYNQPPSKPVILDISLEFIDNMLIVNPPRETQQVLQETQSQNTIDYLDFNDLDVDFLAEDVLDNEAQLEFTELDINYLDVNFLEDLLSIIDALDVSEEEDTLSQVATSIRIAGTEIGQDKTTQITTIVTGQMISLRRNVGQSVRLDLDGSNAYTVILFQDGVENVVKVNGGSINTITIKQGS
tara:strand:- start:9901 stop:10998 length:1098 start_codon:yes stop_codon:yes gene_type:complete